MAALGHSLIRPPDSRFDQLFSLVMKLASGDLSAREEPSEAGDELDAVILGVNMLAEDLETSRAELERRVETRTAELAQLNVALTASTELGSLLPACESLDEVDEVLRQGIPMIFARLSGAVYRSNASRNNFEKTIAWGPGRHRDALVREECWALRRGRTNVVRAGSLATSCPHAVVDSDELSHASTCIPMAARGDTLGLVCLASPAGGGLSDAEIQLGVAVATKVALALANLELRQTLRHQALRDPLTGLYNRRFVEDWMEREVARSQRAGTSLGILMVDIDAFKQLNDSHGHDVGDRCLKEVADVMRAWTRSGDLPCRYGGDEFLIIVTDISGAELTQRAEELRAAVALRTIASDGRVPAVTVSIGAASYPEHGDSAAQVVKAADAALYVAKRAGRNRVVSAG